MDALGLLLVLRVAARAEKPPDRELFQVIVDATMAYLDAASAQVDDEGRTYLQSACLARCGKGVALPSEPAVALPFGGRDAVSVHDAAEFLYDCCEETVRRLVRTGQLQVVRVGKGRCYRVLVNSLVAHKEAMKRQRNGNPEVAAEA